MHRSRSRGGLVAVLAAALLSGVLSAGPAAAADPGPVVSLGDASGLERDSVTGSVFVPVFLSKAADEPVTVSFSTTAGSATSNVDYSRWGTPASPKTVTIPAGTLQGSINVPVRADALVEPDETFTVVASSVSGADATLGDSTGLATIVDADGVSAIDPAVTVSSGTVVEGDAGQRRAQFQIQLSRALPSTATFTYVTADGTAVAPGDYTARALTTVKFAAGQISKSVDVPVSSNNAWDANRDFSLVVAASAGGPPLAPFRMTGVATIVNDDPLIIIGGPDPCPAGTFSADGKEPCTPAPAGSFVAGPGATAPTPCSPGRYQPLVGQTSCTPAAPGSYVPGPGSTASTLCDPGYFQPLSGQTSCTPAPPGSYVDTPGATASTPCQPGYVQPLSGQTSCTPVPPGNFRDLPGGTAPSPCQPGSYQPNAAQTSCYLAPAGTYVDAPGATAATPCAKGSFQPSAGQTSCNLAPTSSYVDTVGATSATPCPAGTTTSGPGATSVDDCASPDAPLLTSAEFTSGGTRLEFLAPLLGPGETVTGYYYEFSCDGGETFLGGGSLAGTTSAQVVGGGACENGRTDHPGWFRITATIDDARQTSASNWQQVRAIGPPSLSTARLTAGGTELTFAPPGDLVGDQAVTDYFYEFSCDGGATTLWFGGWSPAVTTSPQVASGGTCGNGTTDDVGSFRVIAYIDSTWPTPPSDWRKVATIGAPSMGDAQLTTGGTKLTFSPSPDLDGQVVTGYFFQFSCDGVTPLTGGQLAGTTSPQLAGGGTCGNGTTDSPGWFQIQAIIDSTWATPWSNWQQAGSVGAPSVGDAQLTTGGTKLWFSPPPDLHGDQAVTGYSWQFSCDGGATVLGSGSVAGTTSPQVAGGGTCGNGTTDSPGWFQIQATIDSTWATPWSNWQQAGSVGAPSVSDAQLTTGGTKLTFSPPGDLHGDQAVTGYSFQFSCDGGATVLGGGSLAGTTSPQVAGGGTCGNGTTDAPGWFQIQATIDSTWATPWSNWQQAGSVGAPSVSDAQLTTGGTKLSFAPPGDLHPGQTVTGYYFEFSCDSGATWQSGRLAGVTSPQVAGGGTCGNGTTDSPGWFRIQATVDSTWATPWSNWQQAGSIGAPTANSATFNGTLRSVQSGGYIVFYYEPDDVTLSVSPPPFPDPDQFVSGYNWTLICNGVPTWGGQGDASDTFVVSHCGGGATATYRVSAVVNNTWSTPDSNEVSVFVPAPPPPIPIN